MNRQSTITTVTASAILIAFAATLYFNFTYKSADVLSKQLVRNIIRVHDALQKIHDDCTIIDFDYQKNTINFLNVKSFVGSEVGPVNLVYPEKWNGPYMDDNPTFHEIEYQVVATDSGYFVTPGDGIKLPNGKIVGTNIVLDKSTDVISLMADENALRYGKYIFAKRLELKKKVDERLMVMPNV